MTSPACRTATKRLTVRPSSRSTSQTLTFQNDSPWVHIIGPGEKGLLTPVGKEAMAPMKMMEENDTYTTPPWMTPGTYLLTCTVHPEMNAKVVVLG